MSLIKKMYRKLLFHHRSDSDSMIKYLRSKGMQIGERVRFFSPETTEIDVTRPYMISIGNDVQITKGVTILTHGYDWAVIKGMTGEILGSAGRVCIGNNVFIGMNSTILKGVTIGDNVIIGANTLVNKSVPANSVVGGNPVRLICDIESYAHKRLELQIAEARELCEAYFEVYKKVPPPEEFREFFWLFSDDPDDLLPCYEKVMELVGNKTLSDSKLKDNIKQFENYDSLVEELLCK